MHQRRLTHSRTTDPPRPQPPHRAAPPRAAHTPKHKPQGHTASKDPSAPAKSHTKARLAAESPREVVGPTGRRRRSTCGASTPPNKDASCTELSPRNLPVGVAIAIGPWREKPGPKPRLPSLGARCLRTRAHGCKTRLPQQLFIPSNQSRPACTRSSPSKSSKASRCLGLCESSHSACGCESRSCPP